MVKTIEKFQKDKNYLIVYTGRRAIHREGIMHRPPYFQTCKFFLSSKQFQRNLEVVLVTLSSRLAPIDDFRSFRLEITSTHTLIYPRKLLDLSCLFIFCLFTKFCLILALSSNPLKHNYQKKKKGSSRKQLVMKEYTRFQLDINFRLNFIHYFYKHIYYFTEIQEFIQIGS